MIRNDPEESTAGSMPKLVFLYHIFSIRLSIINKNGMFSTFKWTS